MIKPASELHTTVTRRQIIEYLEDYISEYIEKAANNGQLEICVSGMSISVNPKTGEFCKGLHSRSAIEDFVWQWHSIRDHYDEVSTDFKKAGYRVYDKNNNGCVWIGWN